MEDNYIIPLFISGTIMFVVFVFFIIFFIIISKQRRNNLFLEKKKAIFEEQERTMSQISREVHDNLGGLLNLAMMNIHVIRTQTTGDNQKEAIDNAGSIITQLIADAHNISYSLNSNYIKKRGLFDVLKSQLKYISSSRNIKCDIEITGNDNNFTEEEELLIYRIAQEALQNSVKHAAASQLNIVLGYASDEFTMTIADNGIGCNENGPSSGIGIMNMKERAKILNGVLDIKSPPCEGLSVRLTIKHNRSK